MSHVIIADPPYPPRRRRGAPRAGGPTYRASRWYGKPGTAEFHPAASDWDRPETHRRLLEHLEASADGWAIATTPDGIAAYGALPPEVRILAWVRMNAQPGGNRLRSCWEAVLVRQIDGRHRGRGQIADVLQLGVHNRAGFVGSKPVEWTRWVLDAIGYEDQADTAEDLFPGSGAVSAALAQPVLAGSLP